MFTVILAILFMFLFATLCYFLVFVSVALILVILFSMTACYIDLSFVVFLFHTIVRLSLLFLLPVTTLFWVFLLFRNQGVSFYKPGRIIMVLVSGFVLRPL